MLPRILMQRIICQTWRELCTKLDNVRSGVESTNVGLYPTSLSKHSIDRQAVVQVPRRQKSAAGVQMPLNHLGSVARHSWRFRVTH